jgi:hypothetical protein
MTDKFIFNIMFVGSVLGIVSFVLLVLHKVKAW